MSGGSGMTSQLGGVAGHLEIHHAVMRWLQARCQSAPWRDLFESAVKRYLASHGSDLVLVGVLIRDTQPNEKDLQAAGQTLSAQLSEPTRVELLAWHVPVPIAEWPTLVQEESA